jgi:hypothetical protein
MTNQAKLLSKENRYLFILTEIDNTGEYFTLKIDFQNVNNLGEKSFDRIITLIWAWCLLIHWRLHLWNTESEQLFRPKDYYDWTWIESIKIKVWVKISKRITKILMSWIEYTFSLKTATRRWKGWIRICNKLEESILSNLLKNYMD